ncbi:hypothetical protein [Rheinheimera sp.]|uniref:hypothetical protein n=1 Tax=Rheinheimera sp. TaxID=1869214 RepID=UPI0026071CD3|nr:hypothetical protein [Rheinheimera sp.]MCA1930148.1 hypothetical protein [Rheinheimera sp.]
MYFIAAFALLMLYLSLFMLFRPQAFSQGIINFSGQSYFHPFEVLSRLIAGGLFVVYADDCLQPELIRTLGYLFLLVGIGLAFTKPALHKKFALESARRLQHHFRWIGFCSVFLSFALLHLATGTTYLK